VLVSQVESFFELGMNNGSVLDEQVIENAVAVVSHLQQEI
jgi:hypothetical protein